jgi:inner membrane protein
MDNVTHTLVGLMIARTGLARCPPGTPVMMMVAANLPDVDVVSGLRGSLSYLENHRGYTHALASAPLMALIPLLVLVAVFRQRISLQTYLLSLIGVLSHLLLDWTNVYGIRLLLPFSGRWLRLDSTDIVDPWILAILILAVAAPALARLVSAEIGSRKGNGAKRGWAWFALVMLAAYDGGRYAAHQRALAVMGTRLYEGAAAHRITALPSRVNPLRWRGVVEGEGFAVFVPVDLSEEFDPSAGRIEYPADSSPAMDAARRTPAFEVFGKFSQLPFWKISPLAGATHVELIDLRFGTPQHPGFEAVALVDPSGAVHESGFTFGSPPVRAP